MNGTARKMKTMKELLVCCIFICLLDVIPFASSQKISCTAETNNTLTMTLDCVFLGPGPVGISQKVLIKNHIADTVELITEAMIVVDGKTFIHSDSIVMPPQSVLPQLWTVPACGLPSLVDGSGNVIFNITVDSITCPVSFPNCQDNITLVQDESVITGPQFLMIPPNNQSGLTIRPSKNDLPFYAILNISSTTNNEAYRVQFELLGEEMPFREIIISAGKNCPDDGPFLIESAIQEDPFSVNVDHVAPGLMWVKLVPSAPYNTTVVITAQQKRIGPATCHKDTGMCENNRNQNILIIVAISLGVGIAMVTAVVIAYKQRNSGQKEPERYSLMTGQ